MAPSNPSPAGLALQERLLASQERRFFRRDYVLKRHYTVALFALFLLGLLVAAAGVVFRVALRMSDRTVARQATLTRTDILTRLEPGQFLLQQRADELAMIELGARVARASFDPQEAESALRVAEWTLGRTELTHDDAHQPSAFALRLADAIESAGAAGAAGGERLAEIGRRSRSRQAARRYCESLRHAYLHVPAGSIGGAAPAVIAEFMRRGYRVHVIGEGESRSESARVIVSYAFNDRTMATQAAHDFGVAMRKTLGRKRPEMFVGRVGEASLFGGRPGAVEIWLPTK